MDSGVFEHGLSTDIFVIIGSIWLAFDIFVLLCPDVMTLVLDPATGYCVKLSVSCCCLAFVVGIAASIRSCVGNGPWSVHLSEWGGSMGRGCQTSCTFAEQWCNPSVLSFVPWCVAEYYWEASCKGLLPLVMDSLKGCPASTCLPKKVRTCDLLCSSKWEMKLAGNALLRFLRVVESSVSLCYFSFLRGFMPYELCLDCHGGTGESSMEL